MSWWVAEWYVSDWCGCVLLWAEGKILTSVLNVRASWLACEVVRAELMIVGQLLPCVKRLLKSRRKEQI